MKPFRQMVGQPAPGEDLGGWYRYDPNYDFHKDDAEFAPFATFGQWVSALARVYAITGSPAAREKVLRLNRLYALQSTGNFTWTTASLRTAMTSWSAGGVYPFTQVRGRSGRVDNSRKDNKHRDAASAGKSDRTRAGLASGEG